MANSGIYEEDYQDDSDHDSLYADSPSDGYFTQRDHPQQTFVETSGVQAESEAKAREAAESRASNAAETPPRAPSHSSPTSSIRSPVWAADDSAPVLDAGPAPPDYAAATAGRSPPHSRSDSSPRSEPEVPREEDQSSQRSHARSSQSSHSYSNYGSISQQAINAALGPESERQWPLGPRGNPFQSNQFPFGPNGNPLTSPNFPFGPNGSPFNTSRQPERMGDRSEEEDEEHADEERGLLRPRRTKKKSKAKWRRVGRCCCKPMTLLNIAFGVAVIALIVLLARATREVSRTDGSSDADTPEDPSASHTPKSPNSGDGDGDGEDTTNPGDSYPNPHPHPDNPACPYRYFTNSMTFDFAHSSNFTFHELLEPTGSMTGGISGNIWLMPAPADQETDVRVYIWFASTQLFQVTDMTYWYTKGRMEMAFRDGEWKKKGAKNCLDIAVNVYVKEGAEVEDLKIVTGNLDVNVDERFFGDGNEDGDAEEGGPRGLNTTHINAIRGNVRLPYWISRRTVIESWSGSISGTYALRDLLSVRSHSGTTNINVQPMEASKTTPRPAEFTATSHSGSLHVGLLRNDGIPDRDYRSRIETHSGSISGTYILGSTAAFYTQSGSLDADLMPCFSNYVESTLHTDSGSATTSLSILSPIWNSLTTIDRLKSSHKSRSGSLTLNYPQEWEGTVEGRTHSGSISARGRDLKKLVDDDLGPAGKQFVARKGYGHSKLGFGTQSGSVSLRIGDY